MNPKNLIHWLALTAITVMAIYVCWLLLLPFLDVLIWAAVLVIVFNPIHRRISARVKSPSGSAALSSLLVIVTIVAPVTLATIAVAAELRELAGSLQGGIASFLDPTSPAAAPVFDLVGRYVDIERFRNEQYLAERVQALSGTLAQRSLGVVGGVIGAVVQAFFVIFTMFYLFRDGKQMASALQNALPLECSQSAHIFSRTREVVSASVYGVLMIAAIQGALGALAFWALGLPSPLVWGVLMFLLSMIPMAGSFIVWLPAAIYLALTGELMKAALLAAWGALVIGTVDNFLRPKLVGEKTRLHELLIFFSVLGGLQVFGVLGIVLGPVMVAVTLALLEVFRQAERPPEETRREDTLLDDQEDLRNVA